jgi:tripartite-type tricarboxylate transporter receptor subunit TctC
MRFGKLALLGAVGLLASLAGLQVSAPAAAQEQYPSRPIELIVPWGPGGGADQLARLVAKLLEPQLGQAVPVVNVPGGTGATGMAKLLAAPADGHSMAIYIADSHALLAGPEARWTMDDIIPVAVMIQAPSFLFAPKDSKYQSWADFETAAKAAPGTLKVATLGFGSVDDFSLKHLAGKGVEVVQVPFSKPSERYVSILGGHADLLYEQAGDVAQFIQSGEMRPILVFGDERSQAFPDVPSSKELGYNVALPQFRAIVVKGGTKPEQVEALSKALATVAESAEFKEFLNAQYASGTSFLAAGQASPFVGEQLEAMKAAAATQ